MQSETSERKVGVTLLLILFFLFMVCRTTQVSDSQFNMLAAHNYYVHQHGNLRAYLDHPALQNAVRQQFQAGVIKAFPAATHEAWRLTYPQTPMLLAIPFVFLMDHLGLAVAQENPPFWRVENENRQQHILASFLMSLYGYLIYRLARIWLPQNAALFLILPLVLGSSVISGLSRAAWTDTWAALLSLIAIVHLARVQVEKRELNVWLVASMCALAFFCKPIYALSAMACVAWAWQLHRQHTIKLCVLGGIFAVIFIAWSSATRAQGLLSNYSFAYFSAFDTDYLLGPLISPSRGMLVFWTWIIPMMVALWGLWKKITATEKRIIVIAAFPFIALIIILSFYPQWHGGIAYGPRLNIPALPWLSLMAIMITAVWLRERPTTMKVKAKSWLYRPPSLLMGSVLIALSVLINFYGAMQPKTFAWHVVAYVPKGETSTLDKQYQQRFWDWRDPIFLAGIIRPERYFIFSVEGASSSTTTP